MKRPENFDFDSIVRRWQLGYLNGEDLPDVAYFALEAGIDAPSLYELAGLERPAMRDAGPIFKRALDELGRFSGTVAEQPMHFAAELARRILSREIGVIAGCREMMSIRNRGGLYDCRDLDPFVYVESETDTLPFGAVRARWSDAALENADREIAGAEIRYRDGIDEACRELIAATDAKKTEEMGRG